MNKSSASQAEVKQRKSKSGTSQPRVKQQRKQVKHKSSRSQAEVKINRSKSSRTRMQAQQRFTERSLLAMDPSFGTRRADCVDAQCRICFWHRLLACGLRFKHERCPQTIFLHALGIIAGCKALINVVLRRLPESVNANTLCGANRFEPPPMMMDLSPPSAMSSDIQRTRPWHGTNSCSYWHAV